MGPPADRDGAVAVLRAAVEAGITHLDTSGAYGPRNLVHRHDDALVDRLAAHGIAYVPFFPLGGFTPLQSQALSTVAARRGTTPLFIALASLLQRSPNIPLIPGASSTAHLRENITGAACVLTEQDGRNWGMSTNIEICRSCGSPHLCAGVGDFDVE